jgi:histidyl-tRNA synthetase
MAGVPTEADFSGKSLKSLMKRADRMGASFVLMVGESELKEGRVVLRDMKTKEQHAFPVDKLTETITNFLNR